MKNYVYIVLTYIVTLYRLLVIKIHNINHCFNVLELSGKFTRTILIEASDDIVVYALNKIKFSSDGYLAIPVDATGYDYFTASITVTDSSKLALQCVIAFNTGQS